MCFFEFDYLIATAHSAGPGHGLCVQVICYRMIATPWAMLRQSLGHLWMNLCLFGIHWVAVGNVEAILRLSLGVLGTTWVYLGAILGHVRAMLGLSWGLLGLRY